MKRHILIACMLAFVLMLASCKEAPRFIYDVPKGDMIEVEFDASKTDYLLSGAGDSFSVGTESKTMVEGSFSNWSLAEMEYYLTTNDAKITNRTDIELVWDDPSSPGDEYNIVRQLSDKTILIMTAKGGKDFAEDIYDRLYFKMVNPDDVEASDIVSDGIKEKDLIKPQPTSGSDAPSSIFKIHKISFTVPGMPAVKKSSAYEYVITADKSIIELELAPVGKNMTSGAMTVKGYVNNLGGDIQEISETRINGFLVGVATFSMNGNQEKAYIFTSDKRAYALRSRDIELLDSVINTLKFGR